MVKCYTLHCISLRFTSTGVHCMVHCTAVHCMVHCTAVHCMVHTALYHCTSLRGAVPYNELYFTTLHKHCTSLPGAVLYTAQYFTTLQQYCTPLHFTAWCGDQHCTHKKLTPLYLNARWSALHDTAPQNNVLHFTTIMYFTCTYTAIITTASSSLKLEVWKRVAWCGTVEKDRYHADVKQKNRLPLVQLKIRQWPFIISTTLRLPRKVIGIVCS